MLLLLACQVPGGGSPEDSADSAVDTADPRDTAQTGDTSDTTDSDPPPYDPPEWCPAAEAGRQGVTSTDASPYFVMHPLEDTHDNPLVVLLPGGAGNDLSAKSTWDAFFDDDPRGYRLVEPWVITDDYPDVAPPVEALLDEVATCFGTPSEIHLLGHSNGGYLAYNVVGPDLADRFASISGAPAYFTHFKKTKLEGLPFHNMVGEDDSWLEYVEEAHQELLDAGFESELSVWPDQGHTPDAAWDGRDDMFAFWDAH
jgi:pimeloyl-ACP methyl ester carboxylesterase